MKEKINVFDYSDLIIKSLKPGLLLNTNGDKFNSMVIGWGHLGVVWGIETFIVYVRQSRYTKSQLDKTGRFTISVPMNNEIHPEIFKVFGSQSGKDINKADYVLLEEANLNNTPGIKQYPLTIECEVIYSQDQELDKIPTEIVDRHYPEGDFHTMYIGKILDAYIIKEDKI